MHSSDNRDSVQMDNRTALFLAAVCNQAYLQQINKGRFLLPKGYTLVGSFQSSGLNEAPSDFGFLLESEEAAVLAFRGTNSASEWVTDLMADQVEFPYVSGSGLTHRGFTSVYSQAREQILDLVEELPAGKPLFITGHSLGGALATMAALDIAINAHFTAAPSVYTFASPRVGDLTFVTTYNRAIPVSFRIENNNDIVTRLPPLVFRDPRLNKMFYYLHVKQEVPLSFSGGSVSGNHLLDNYFAQIAKGDRAFASVMCSSPAGWCPDLKPLPNKG